MSSRTIAGLFCACLLLADMGMAQGRDCFFPDHTTAENFTECNAGATESSCCRNSEACLSNGYCLQQVGLANRITRGACTDSTFSNAACPQACTDVATGSSMSFFLAYDDTPNGVFCCYPGYNVTSQQCRLTSTGAGTTDPFQLPQGSVIIDRSNGATLSINTTASASSTVTITAQAKSDNSNITAVGAGVGVSLGVLLIAALMGCAVLWSQLRKAKRQIPRDGVPLGTSNHHDHPKENHAFAPGNRSQAPYDDGMNKPYTQAGYQGQPPMVPVESPFNNVLAEAPTDREVAMADSRAVGK